MSRSGDEWSRVEQYYLYPWSLKADHCTRENNSEQRRVCEEHRIGFSIPQKSLSACIRLSGLVGEQIGKGLGYN